MFQNPARSRWLPLDSRVYGPPRRWAHTPKYCEEHALDWREVIPAGTIERRAPRCTNYPASEMLELTTTKFGASGTARLRNARVVGPGGWIVAEDDTYLPDHNWFGDAIDECPIYKRSHVASTKRLGGVTLTLCTDWSNNYGHVVFDALPRIHLFELAGYGWNDVSHVLMPELSSQGKQAMAARCGVPLEKTVTLGADDVVECEDLIAPTFPGARRNTPRWVAEFWRAKAPGIEQKRHRLFVSRRGSIRTILNEDELAAVLDDFGFETIVSSDRAIGDRYPEAEIIIGPHGAALADILLCHPGSVLIELVPPRHIFPYYYTIADSVGMEYFSILGRDSNENVNNPKTADFTVSPRELWNAILAAEEFLSHKSATDSAQASARNIA